MILLNITWGAIGIMDESDVLFLIGLLTLLFLLFNVISGNISNYEEKERFCENLNGKLNENGDCYRHNEKGTYQEIKLTKLKDAWVVVEE